MILKVSEIIEGLKDSGVTIPSRIKRHFIPGRVIFEKISYKSEALSEERINASALIVRRDDTMSKGIVMVMHPTISVNEKAPSRILNCYESILALAGYTLIVPDYIGFGDSSELVHPYMHAETVALDTIHCFYAAANYLVDMENICDMSLDVIGYSEGGFNAMAFCKYVQQKKYREIVIKRLFSGAAPYDLNLTMDIMINNGETGYPYGVVMVPVGLNAGDELGLNFRNIFTGRLSENYEDWLESKNYRTSEVNELIGSNDVSSFMHPDFYTEEKNEDILKLIDSMKRNSLVKGWKPDMPAYLFHSEGDDYLDVENSRNIYRAFKDVGADVSYKEIRRRGHREAMFYFIFHVLEELENEY